MFVVVACLASGAFGGDVVIENKAFRLTLDAGGFAKSLVAKGTGEECLCPGVRIPFARLRQDRPYDNEIKLVEPAKPRFFASNRIVRSGDVLEIGFDTEYHVLKLRVREQDDYVAFVPEGTDYVITDDFGDKRRTELDGIEFLRLPAKSKARFGACANVTWDDSSALSVMALRPEVRCDGDAPEGTSGWRLFQAGTENRFGLFGRGAALVATESARFLDRVDSIERDYGLPRGARNRRDPIMKASYYFVPGPLDERGMTIDEQIDEHISWMKKGGFRVCMLSYVNFSTSCGHFEWSKSWKGGLSDLKRVTDRLRAEGIVPGLHFHYNKVSISDPYFKTLSDPRVACVREVCLAADVGPDDAEFPLQSAPNGLRTEKGRRLVRFGDELVSYESFTTERPWKLCGVKRGEGGTPRASHRRGEYGRHYDVDDWYYFHRIDQDTEIQDEMAARLGEILDAGGFRLLYFDGAEDVPPPFWHYVPLAQLRVWKCISREPRGAEAAIKSHFGWHMMSRGNAFDTFYPERTRQALDKWILPAARMAADDFSTVNFGWIGFFLPGEKTRRADFLANNNFADTTGGTSPEQMEMLAKAAYDNNAPLSVQFSLRKLRVHPKADAIMAVIKKYEDMKFPAGTDLSKE